MQLVLSLFSDIGLLDQAFREKGFCVTQQEENNVTLHHNKSVTHRLCKNLCSCGCFRPVFGRKVYYDSSCRKRAQRNRLKERHEKRD